MSRAFVDEDAGDPDDLPERPVRSAPNYVTPRGLALLRSAAARARAALASSARDSREAKAAVRDLRYFEARIGSAVLVDNAGRPSAEVLFGATVETRDAAGASRVRRLVGQDEAEEGGDLVAWDSSLGLALLGAKAGGRVEAEGTTLEVVRVSYPASGQPS